MKQHDHHILIDSGSFMTSLWLLFPSVGKMFPVINICTKSVLAIPLSSFQFSFFFFSKLNFLSHKIYLSFTLKYPTKQVNSVTTITWTLTHDNLASKLQLQGYDLHRATNSHTAVKKMCEFFGCCFFSPFSPTCLLQVMAQHVLGQFLCVTVTESCSKYLLECLRERSEWGPLGDMCVCVCVLKCVCVVCVHVCVRARASEKQRLSGAESRELADGQRHGACRFNLPASQASNFHVHTSIIQRRRIVRALACHSGRRQTWARRENENGEQGERGREGPVKRETDDLGDGWRDCGPAWKKTRGRNSACWARTPF